MKSYRIAVLVLCLLPIAALLAQDYDSLIQQALQQRNAGDMVAAEQTLRQAWDIPPDKSEVAYLLGMVIAFQERYRESLVLLEQAIADYPESTQLRLARARVLSYQGSYREATLAVNEVLVWEPDNTEALNLAGRIALYQQRPRAGQESFARVLELEPDNLEALLGMFDSNTALGEGEVASSYLERAATLAPEHVDVLSRLQPAVYGSQPKHQVTAGFARSTFDLPGFAEWNDRFFEYRHLEANGNQQYIRYEHNHRFGLNDTLVELGLALGQSGPLPVEVAVGVSPDADFMPSFLTRLQARKLLLEGSERLGTMVLTGLYQYSVFDNGRTQRLATGLEYYLPNANAWLTPAIGMVRDQDGIDTFAWSMGAHWQITGGTRVGLNYSDAPETENLITIGSRTHHLYLRQTLTDRVWLLLNYSRFKRENSYTREYLDAVLQYRF